MKHPIEEFNRKQETFLEQLPEEARPYQRKLFSVGNAAYCYHQQAPNKEPNEDDFKDWLQGLPASIRKMEKARGFEACKTSWPFLRHVMERRDIGLNDWMKEHLTHEEYEFWKSQAPAKNKDT